MLKKLIRLNADDLLLCGGIIGGVFLLLHIITAIAVRFSGEMSSLLLSGILLPITAGIMILGVAVAHATITFDQALRFGQTRRRALGLTLGVTGFETLFSMVLAALLAVLERLFAPAFWMLLTGAAAVTWEGAMGAPSASALFIEDFSLAWWWYPLIALGCMVVGLIIGALIQRYGSKGGWFLWALWMAFIVVFQLLPWKKYTIVDWLFPLLGMFLLASFLWSVWSLLHAVVKN